MMPHYWRPLAHERNSIFKCKQHTCTLHDPWGPEKYVQFDIIIYILYNHRRSFYTNINLRDFQRKNVVNSVDMSSLRPHILIKNSVINAWLLLYETLFNSIWSVKLPNLNNNHPSLVLIFTSRGRVCLAFALFFFIKYSTLL